MNRCGQVCLCDVNNIGVKRPAADQLRRPVHSLRDRLPIKQLNKAARMDPFALIRQMGRLIDHWLMINREHVFLLFPSKLTHSELQNQLDSLTNTLTGLLPVVTCLQILLISWGRPAFGVDPKESLKEAKSAPFRNLLSLFFPLLGGTLWSAQGWKCFLNGLAFLKLLNVNQQFNLEESEIRLVHEIHLKLHLPITNKKRQSAPLVWSSHHWSLKNKVA